MKSLLIVGIFLGMIDCGYAQVPPSADDQKRLVGRWELTLADMPMFSKAFNNDVIIENNIITMKLDCNRVTLTYLARDGELTAKPITSTLLACDPRRVYSFERTLYEMLQHSKYQVDDRVLRLTSFDDPASSWSLELHRVN